MGDEFEVIWSGAMTPAWSDQRGGLLPPRDERRDPNFAAHAGESRDGLGTLNRLLRKKGLKHKPVGIVVNPSYRKRQ
jgi:hypothetical protein